MSLVTVQQAKTQLGILASDTSDDAELQFYCDALTPAIEDYKHEIIELREITEDVELHGRHRFRLWSVPLVSLTSMVDVVTGVDWDVSTLRPNPSGVVRVLPGNAPPHGLFEVTYEAGYAEVPINYQLGALMVLQDTWESQRGAGGTVDGMVDVGEERAVGRQYTPEMFRRARNLLGAPRPLIG